MTILDRIQSLSQINEYKELYRIPAVESLIDFTNRFVMTYDPRLTKDKSIPLFTYPKQNEYLQFLFNLWKNKENGVVDKCRDVGATWLFISFSVWLLLFQKDNSIGLYTYKADEVDKLGDISTLFGKARFIIDNLPKEFRQNVTANYFYIRNHDNNSDIAGMSGDNPGRGGRRTIIFKDESAFYEHAEMIEAALSETSNCVVDISTHQGTNTLFYNKIQSGNLKVFEFNWWDIPTHTQEWYDKKKKEMTDQGLNHIFQREIERNPNASITNVVLPFHLVQMVAKCQTKITGKRIAGFDVADTGSDKKTLCIMDGNVLIYINEWVEGDVEYASEIVFNKATEYKCDEIRYDSIGVGAGAKVKLNQLKELTNSKIKIIGWSASNSVMSPDLIEYGDRTNKEMFENAKSQAYWRVRNQLENTYRFMNNESCNENDILCLCKPDDNQHYNKFLNQLSQAQFKTSTSGKIVIDKKPNNSASPDLCEAFIICRTEIEQEWQPWSII